MRILVPVDESLHSRRVIEFISHRETLLGTTPEIELCERAVLRAGNDHPSFRHGGGQTVLPRSREEGF